jgi:hypothetical protein
VAEPVERHLATFRTHQGFSARGREALRETSCYAGRPKSSEGFRPDGWNDRPFSNLRALNAETIPRYLASLANCGFRLVSLLLVRLTAHQQSYMPETRSSATNQIVWPWFVCGAISPLGARLLSGALKPWLADGLSFFVFFAAASSLVLRSSGNSPHPLRRSVLGAAAGALIVAAFRYLNA